MHKSFSPSTNILADEYDFSQYIITSNVQSVFDLITANYRCGFRSFNLIGAYGTGKSSFLSALTRHLGNDEQLFVDVQYWKKIKSFEVIKLVGDYTSLLNVLKCVLHRPEANSQQTLEALVEYIAQVKKQDKGVILLVDEFGKFLEYAATHNPEKELYFMQLLAELANRESHDFALITTLHQDFSAYAANLDKVQRDEWTKVKGRFKEITFNEPVEQLIYLAGKRLNGEIPADIQNDFISLFKAIKNAGAFPLRDFFLVDFAEKLYPLDILSTAILSLSLQQYGQNERSLFTFLDAENYLGLQDFDSRKANFYSISKVYDFLSHNLNSFLRSKTNPDYSKWAEIRVALERCESEILIGRQAIYHTIIKTIGMLHIFSHAGATINEEFLNKYIGYTDKFDHVGLAIAELLKKKIIRFSQHSKKFLLFEGTDIDIDVAIGEAGRQLTGNVDIVSYLSGYFNFPTTSAKKAYFKFGTPRIFQYKITESPLIRPEPTGEIDGFINLIFNDRNSEPEVIKASGEHNEAVLYGVFQNTRELKDIIQEIQKAEIARERHQDDRIVTREANQIIDAYKSLLSHYVLGNFHNPLLVRWFFKGRRVMIGNDREFNSQLSVICEEVYKNTPIFKSELSNRSKLSPSISTARKALINAVLMSWKQENIFMGTGFPPERSIYLSLLKETGIHRKTENGWVLDKPVEGQDNYNFLPLWNESVSFLQSSKGAKRNIGEFYEQLSQSPFKLKKGFLDFWIPVFLIIKQADFALYGKNGFIPELDGEILELAVRNPKDYALKAFDVEGVRIDLFNQYRLLLNLEEEGQTSNEAFIQTIRPFIKFYKELPEYTKATRRLSRATLRVKAALIEATDPEKIFFEDFPQALGFEMALLESNPDELKNYVDALQLSIKELRSAFADVLNRFESTICSLWNKELNFDKYKDLFRSRYGASLRQHLLLPYQKVFYQRLCSPLEDRQAWLSSVAQAVIGKSLEKMTDDDEDRLHVKFLELVHELDNLNDIAKQEVNVDMENVFKLEITSPGAALHHKVFSIPKEKSPKLMATENKIIDALIGENKFTRMALLADLLRKELNDEGK